MRGRQFDRRTPWGVLSRVVLIRINLAVGLIGCCLMVTVLSGPAASPARQALWLMVSACVANFKLTGAAFPCVLVDLTGGEDRGYVDFCASAGAATTPNSAAAIVTAQMIGMPHAQVAILQPRIV
jgi:hypothetical protein